MATTSTPYTSPQIQKATNRQVAPRSCARVPRPPSSHDQYTIAESGVYIEVMSKAMLERQTEREWYAWHLRPDSYSLWSRREGRPRERLLSSDRGIRRPYLQIKPLDAIEAATTTQRRERWGMGCNVAAPGQSELHRADTVSLHT